MAGTTQPWLEDLSEEWIPQTTVDASAHEAHSPPPIQVSQSVPPKQRSRLPRMRQSSGSFSEVSLRHVAKDLRPSKLRHALAERSLSDNNIAQPGSPEESQLEHSRSASFAHSASQGSIDCGTVAHNTVARSPAKDINQQDTPEWRRRIVNGDLGYGDQTDLFGNTGLQNIFQKPSENPLDDDRQQPKGKLGLLKGLSAMPSSPPPWPRATGEIEQREQRVDNADEPQESEFEV